MMPVPIKAWSHSRLVDFSCKRRTFIKVVQRIPEPPRPLPPGKTEHANDRGSRVHSAAEAFVRGGSSEMFPAVELIPELEKFKKEFTQLRDMYARGHVSLEGEWAFDKRWGAVAWKSPDAWCRIKCDAVVTLSPAHVAVIDYKTGKRAYNEVKHGEQMELYSIGVLLRNPQVELVDVELWYTDLDETHTERYSRERALSLVPKWEARGVAYTTETDFLPSPSKWNCRFCPYKPAELGGTGHCDVGV